MLRNHRLFLEDIEKSSTRIILYTEGLTRDQVFADDLKAERHVDIHRLVANNRR